MGSLLAKALGVDHATPYAFKFSGLTLWLLAADPAVQRVIDDFNPNCPRWRAHSTLAYGLGLDEAAARGRFARLKDAVAGTGAVSFASSGPQFFGDYPPYRMRVVGLPLEPDDGSYAALRRALRDHFDTDGSGHPHASLVYDWIGSPRVTPDVADAIRRAAPALRAGAALRFDEVALVDMRDATVGEWTILDRVSLAAAGCDSSAAGGDPSAPSA